MPLLIAAALLAPPAVPAPSPAPAPEAPIVVTASRTNAAPAGDLSVVTADDLAQRQAVTLLDALDDVAGVRAFSTGGIGGGSFISIRGGEPNFTLVLLDGIRVNDPTNSKGGAFDIAQIDPLLVESIEVSRGAASAVHGSDALSGVINIRLRRPAAGASGLVARINGDSFGERGIALNASHGWHDGGALLSASWFDSGSADPGASLRRAQALGRLVQRIGEIDVSAVGLYSHGDRSNFPEDSGGPRYAVNRARETGTSELWTTGLTIRRAPGARISPNLSLSYADQRGDSDTPRIAPGVLAAVPALVAHDRLGRFEATGDVTLAMALITATIGASYRHERGRSDGTIDFGFFRAPASFALTRATYSGFAEATVRPLPRLSFNLGARYDKPTGSSGQTTARAAIEWRIADGGPTLFGNIAGGFKLPSFYALGHPLIGSATLRPERSRNLAAGAEWAVAPQGWLRLSWYDNRFTDLIDFDPASFKLVNRNRVAARGFELEARGRPDPAVELSAALTHVALQSPTPLRGRPAWHGNVRARWQASTRVAVNGALRFNGDFFDSSVPTGQVTAAGHAELDLGMRFGFSPGFDLDVALRNLTDSHDQPAVGWPARGRFLRATLSATLF